jgi:response regulator RpfG family c-di-GMP phosphodiesterase
MPFTGLLDDLKRLDATVLRIATSRDYQAIGEVVQAIDTGLIYKYFRKPVNYFDLIEIINARTANYQAGRESQETAAAGPAYAKLHSIVDKAKEVEKLRKQLESQMAKVKDIEAESFNKLKDALGEVNKFRKKVEDNETLINTLQAKSLELEELKKRDIDRVELEREALRKELDVLKAECDKLVHEKTEIEHALKEFDFMVTSEKEATLRVTDTIKKADRIKKGGRDSILVVDDEKDITEAFQRVMKNTFNVYTADSGKKAMSVLEENPDICLIITDQRMPEMMGTEFAAQVRKNHADLPIFLLTGYADLTIAIDAMNKGTINKYFDKPVDWALLEAAIEVAIEMYDLTFAQKEIIEDKKAFIVDKIRDLSVEVKTLGYNNLKLTDEINMLKSDNRKIGLEVKKLRAENGDLRVSVARERAAMVEELTREREELARRRDEAERVVEVQRERNKAELQALQDAYEEEKKLEIERLKAELEKDRQAKLAEIEEDRKRAEKEIAGIMAAMAEEKEQLEKRVKEQREKAEAELKHLRESAAKERERLTKEMEVTLTEMKKEAMAEAKELKATATRELDRLKAVTEKKERELTETMIHAKRMAEESQERLKLTEGRIEALESEVEKTVNEKELVLRELESVKADFTVAIQSREALLAELAELRNGMK